MQLSVNPGLCDHIRCGTAHQILQHDVEAVIRVNAMKLGEDAVRVDVDKVVSPIHIAPYGVQAVNRV